MHQSHRQPASIGEETISRHKSPLAFFILVFVLAIPFWLFASLTGIVLLPGLPVSALTAFCPLIASLILVYREDKNAGMVALLKRAFDLKRISAPIWYVPILLLTPAISVLSFVILRLTGTPVPDPTFALLPTLILCLLFFVGALGEELGWSGYVIDPLQDRWGALRASLILGVIWSVFHYIALSQAHRSVEWVAWWSLGTMANRVILVWLYNNAGKSVFAAALFHMTSNVTWQLFPVDGSFFDPRVSGLITAVVAIIIVVVWEPRTLTRYRHQ